MRDVMMEIYYALTDDPVINQMAGGRIKFYDYPATGDVTGPYIVIDPLSPPLPAEHGDGEVLTEDYMYQIDVWTKSRLQTKELAKRIQNVMRAKGFGAYGGAADEYDRETGIYRDARRYRGQEYTEEVEAFM